MTGARVARSFEDLEHLINEGFMYNRTAPRWVNGRAYFYLINPESHKKGKGIIECSFEEYEDIRAKIDEMLEKLHGVKYYTKKKKKEKIVETLPMPRTRAVIDRSYARSIEHTMNISLSLTESTIDLGFKCLLLVLPHLKISPRKLFTMVDDPKQITDLILRYVAKLLDLRFSPERLFSLEDEVRSLEMEKEELEKSVREKDEIIEELKKEVEMLLAISNEDQISRFVGWMNIRKNMNVVPESVNWENMIYMPQAPKKGADDTKWIFDLATAAWILNSREPVPLEVILKYIDVQVKESKWEVKKYVDKKINEVRKELISMQPPPKKDRPNTIIIKDNRTEPSIFERIKMLEERGYEVIPPPSESRVMEIVNEQMKGYLEEVHRKIEELKNYIEEEKEIDPTALEEIIRDLNFIMAHVHILIAHLKGEISIHDINIPELQSMIRHEPRIPP